MTSPQNPVTAIPAATPADALGHYAGLLAYETDCWDVHSALASGDAGFVLLDVRSRSAYDAGHVQGAVHLPHGEIDADTMHPFHGATLFVVYCAGPHCNGADRAAAKLAALGLGVKKMIGGIEGWRSEGFALVTRAQAG